MQGELNISAYKDTGVEVKATITCENYSDMLALKDVINLLFDNKKTEKEDEN